MTANQRAYQALLDEHKARPKSTYEQLAAKAARERWEEALWHEIQRKRSLPPIVRQYRWHPKSAFSADFAAPSIALIIEVDGGLWQRGAHNSAYGYERDRIRDAEALLHGWTVLRVTPAMIERGEAIAYLVRICAARWHEQRAG